jgi:hypothetical protein
VKSVSNRQKKREKKRKKGLMSQTKRWGER